MVALRQCITGKFCCLASNKNYINKHFLQSLLTIVCWSQSSASKAHKKGLNLDPPALLESSASWIIDLVWSSSLKKIKFCISRNNYRRSLTNDLCQVDFNRGGQKYVINMVCIPHRYVKTKELAHMQRMLPLFYLGFGDLVVSNG